MKQMIVLFAVEFDDGTSVKCPVACDSAKAMRTAMTALGRKLSVQLRPMDAAAARGLPTILRLAGGAPVVDWDATLAALEVAAHDMLLVIVEAPASDSARAAINALSAAACSNAEQRTAAPPCEGKSTVLGPKAEEATADAPASDDDEEDDGNGINLTETLAVADKAGLTMRLRNAKPAEEALHMFKKNNVFWKTFAKFSVRYGDFVCTEVAVLSAAAAPQLVDTVRRDAHIATRSFDPSAQTQTSPNDALSDNEYTRHLSVAMTHGKVVRAADRRHAEQVAFHPVTLCMRHSCRPNAGARFNHSGSAPHLLKVRCWAPGGIAPSDEISVLYERVDCAEFMLLPLDRRQKLLQQLYHFTCRCDRCKQVPSTAAAPGATCTAEEVAAMSFEAREATLTGAFFAPTVAASRRAQLATRMRDYFASLCIVSPDSECSLLKAPHELLRCDLARVTQFLLDHGTAESDLRLHRHHWRLSLARLAYVRLVDEQLQRGANPVDKFTFEVLADQLATEGAFLGGYHHALRTYRCFLACMRKLPPKLAAATQKRVLKEADVDWTTMRALDAMRA
jgi:hypothetical protein